MIVLRAKKQNLTPSPYTHCDGEKNQRIKAMTSPGSKKVVPADGSEKNHSGNLGRTGDLNESGSSSGGGEGGTFEYFGQVYHLGSNKIGHEYCHLRYLFIRGKYVEMYKRDPHENPDIV